MGTSAARHLPRAEAIKAALGKLCSPPAGPPEVRPRILGVDHAQITVPRGQEDRAREFYGGVLGLAEVPKPASLQGRGGFWLAVGGIQVHGGTEDDVRREAAKAHLACEVDDVARWRSHLAAHGIQAEDSVPVPGFERFEFRDPFGNRVEMIRAVD